MNGFNCVGSDNKCKPGGLECIKFEGEEQYLPDGWRGMPGVTLEKMFLNWDTVDNPLFLEVDKDYIKNVNKIYNGRGILLVDPQNGKKLTLEEWRQKFNNKDIYNGVLLLGIQKHPKRSGVYYKT